MASSPQLTVIREVLEGMVSPELAVAVLFAALDQGEDEPKNDAEWSAFLLGPLTQALEKRIGVEVAGSVVQQIQAILGSGLRKPEDRLFDVPVERPPRHSELPTGRFSVASGPTRVLVVSRKGKLARRLKAVLTDRILPMVLTDISRATSFVEDFQPNLIIVDETDPLDGTAADVVSGLKRAPHTVLVVIWNDGRRRGEVLRDALEASGARTTHVDRGADGVEPLLDLVRAHHN